MRRNTLRDRIERRKPAIGASIALPSPDLVDFCGFLGFEWIAIDTEHGAIGVTECLEMCRACEAHDMSSVVKVPTLDRNVIMAYLRTGAMGVIVPHIDGAEAAEAVVQAALYPPEGQRGNDMGCRASGYAPVRSDPELLAMSNREILVGVLVEDLTGISNLEAILQVPRVDAVHIGAGDLAASMGYQDREHPAVQKVVAEARRMVLAEGKALFGGAAEVAAARDLIRQGVLLIHTRVTEMWGQLTRAYLGEVHETLRP